MPASQHPNYLSECQHLEKTIDWVKKEKVRLLAHEEILKKEVLEIRKTVSHLQDERLVAKQQLHQYTAKDLKIMDYAQSTPYFGRIDFQENGRDEQEVIYIGKHGLHDQQREVPIVVDWRAPIADIYYSGHSQEVFYKAPRGEIRGKLFLKRRYEISSGCLQEIYDEQTSESKIEDSLKGRGDFLIEALSRSNQGRLKEIVATIQDQQNKVIRSDMLKPLVVQGVAGGGKTTIALHRMAYLIYNNRRSIHNPNYMVVAPNRLFLNYISEILPDLGVEDVFQTTFEDWAMTIIQKKMKLTHRIDQLNDLMKCRDESGRIMATAAKIKGSILFKKVIDNLIRQLEHSIIPNHSLSFEGVEVLEAKAIYQVFITSNLHLALKERILKLKEYLKNKIKSDIKEYYERIEQIYEERLQSIRQTSTNIEALRPQLIQIYDERDEKMKQFKKSIAKGVDAYIASLPPLDVFTFYKEAFQSQEIIKAFGSPVGEDLLNRAIEKITFQLKDNLYDNEDLAPLAYIKMKLFGLDDKNKYNHIVVDEAQDMDEFKLAALREVCINDSFTFVGDLSQGIYSYKGIQNWEKSMKRVFKDRDYHYHILTTSYRSTVEIVKFANEIIKKCDDLKPVLAEPVFRNGDLPSLIQCSDEAHMVLTVIKTIHHLKEEQYQSVAVICKDLTTTEKVYGLLNKKIKEVYLLTDQTTDFKEGVVIIPSYLAKGLEFDTVILWDVNEATYQLNPIDVKLLYIGATRALHKLVLLYQNNLSKVLGHLSEGLIQHQ